MRFVSARGTTGHFGEKHRRAPDSCGEWTVSRPQHPQRLPHPARAGRELGGKGLLSPAWRRSTLRDRGCWKALSWEPIWAEGVA